MKYITGTQDSDSLNDTKDTDTIIGLDGDDILRTGHGGMDRLIGGSNARKTTVTSNGSDTYVILPSESTTTSTQRLWVYDNSISETEIDVLDLSGIASGIGDLRFMGTHDLQIVATHPTDATRKINITLLGQFDHERMGIETIRIGSKTWDISPHLNLAELRGGLFLGATDGADVLRTKNWITFPVSAGNGDDEIHGSLGTDMLYGGTGNDTLYSGEGGNAQLTGGNYNWIKTSDSNGSDTFVIEPSASPRHIHIFDRSTSDTEIDTLDLSAVALNLKQLSFFSFSWSRSQSDLNISVNSTDGSPTGTIIHIRDQFSPYSEYPPAEGFSVIEKIKTGSEILDLHDLSTREAVDSVVNLGVSGSNDTVHGAELSENTIFSLDGNDTIFGGKKNDKLDGGPGDDTFYTGTDGNDHMSDPSGSDIYIIQDKAGHSNNRYIVVEDKDISNSTTDTLDLTDFIPDISKLTFSRNINPKSYYPENDLFIRSPTPTDTIGDVVIIKDQFSRSKNRSDGKGIEYIRHGEQTWNVENFVLASEFSSLFNLGADDNNNTLLGNLQEPNELHGFGGDDHLYGGNKRDLLAGGEGNDTLYIGGFQGASDQLFGGTFSSETTAKNGSDTYKIQGKENQRSTYSTEVTIYDNAWSNSEIDTLDFGNFVPKDGTLFFTGDENLTIELTKNQIETIADITIKGQFKNTSDGIGIERIKIGNKSWNIGEADSASEVTSRIVYGATSGADILRAPNDGRSSYPYDHVLMGFGGKDKLFGNLGSDELIGGHGNDKLYTGNWGKDFLRGGDGSSNIVFSNGSDTYVLNRKNKNGTYNDDQEIMIEDFARSSRENDTLDLTGFGKLYDLNFIQDPSGDLLIKPADNSSDQTNFAGHGYVRILKQFDSHNTYLGIETLKHGKRTQNINQYATLSQNISAFVHGTSNRKDIIHGSPDHENSIFGMNGNDVLYGGEKDDVINGGRGNDSLHPGGGYDTLIGGKGNDRYFLSWQGAKIIERKNRGTDTVFTTCDNPYVLPKNVENLNLIRTDKTSICTGTGNSQNNTIRGTWGTDELAGKKGRDTLIGRDGVDLLLGGRGKDRLIGGGGSDVLGGQKGGDVITGGAGKDYFAYASPDQGLDKITDFNRSDGDKIAVNRKKFRGFTNAGQLDAQRFVANKNGIAMNSGTYFVFNTRTHTLYYDPDGSGRKATVKLATFSNKANLTNTDIVSI